MIYTKQQAAVAAGVSMRVLTTSVGDKTEYTDADIDIARAAKKSNRKPRQAPPQQAPDPVQVAGSTAEALAGGIILDAAEDIQADAYETSIQARLAWDQAFGKAMLIPREQIDDPRLEASRQVLRSVLSATRVARPFDQLLPVTTESLLYGSTTPTLQIEAAVE